MAKTLLPHEIFEELESQIKDNAKRNVSFRMQTSDYGRLRMLASNFKVRESAVFRYLLRMALAQCAPLYDGSATPDQFIWLLATLGPDIAAHFSLDGESLKVKFASAARASAVEIDAEDYDLIARIGESRRRAIPALESVVGRSVELDDMQDALFDYLTDKYRLRANASDDPQRASA